MLAAWWSRSRSSRAVVDFRCGTTASEPTPNSSSAAIVMTASPRRVEVLFKGVEWIVRSDCSDWFEHPSGGRHFRPSMVRIGSSNIKAVAMFTVEDERSLDFDTLAHSSFMDSDLPQYAGTGQG